MIPFSYHTKINLGLAQLFGKQTRHVSSANQTASKVVFAKQGCRVNGMAGSMAHISCHLHTQWHNGITFHLTSYQQRFQFILVNSNLLVLVRRTTKSCMCHNSWAFLASSHIYSNFIRWIRNLSAKYDWWNGALKFFSTLIFDQNQNLYHKELSKKWVSFGL